MQTNAFAMHQKNLFLVILLLLFALCFASSISFGQNKVNKRKIYYLNAGAMALIDKDPLQALSLTDSSIMLCVANDYDHEKAISLKTKALVLIALGQVNEAESTTQIALAIAESLNQDHLVAELYHTLGYIKMDGATVKEAYGYLQKAYSINVRLKQEGEMAKNLLNLAILNCWLLERQSLGEDQLYKALTLATGRKDKKLEADICSNISSIVARKGDTKLAVMWLRRSNAILSKLGNIPAIVFNLNQEARMAAANGNLEEAGQLAKKAVRLGYSAKKHLASACALRTASAIYAQKGDYKRAFEYHSKFFSIDDSLKKAEKSRLVSLSHLVLKTERQKRQNDLLLKDQLVREEALSQQKIMLLIVGVLVFALSIVTIFLINKNSRVHSLVSQLQEQNFAMSAQKARIEELNTNLEKIVADRTAQLESRTRQILDFASYNSHHVRGPLARILGLASLMRNASSMEEKILFLDSMDDAALEMDKAIKIVNRKLALEKSQATSPLVKALSIL